MSLLNSFSELLVLPLGDLLTGNSIREKLNFLLQSQFWTREQINNFQNYRLRKLISYSYSHIPYYRNLFSELNLKPEDIQTKEDLVKLPILTKATIKKHGTEQFTSTRLSQNNRLKSCSSGSTGEPLFYFTTRDAYSINIAASLRGWYWMGYRLGDKYIKLSQNTRNSNVKRIQDRVSRNLYLATNPLIETNFIQILNEIERYKPKIIRCYPDPLLLLAQYKAIKSNYKYIPHAITTTGNILYPESRREIEETFECKIFDSYNCEGNSTVFECPTHSCYHSAEEYGISEIINDKDELIKTGIGKLISTDLWNFAHPFIRYDTQDLVEVEDTICSCGREHLKILKIIGRDNDVLTMKSGRRFIVHNFTGFFQVDSPVINRSVDQFQIVKQRGNVIVFRLVINERFTQTASDYIKYFWEKELGTSVKIELLEEIPFNNKRRFIINEE